MAKIYARWLDLDANWPGEIIPREQTLEGENVGYDLYDKDPEQRFVRLWADNQTLLLQQNRVITIGVNKEPELTGRLMAVTEKGPIEL